MARLKVRIVCPEHSAFEGEAAFVALPSGDGELGVLPHHASEICTVDAGRVRLSEGAMGTVDRVFVVSGGYAEITGDEVIILAERAVDEADVDADAARAALASFEEQLSNLAEGDARRAYLYNEIAWLKLQLAC